MSNKLGDRVKVLREISLAPHSILRAGERGTIVRMETDEEGLYSADIKMDKAHNGLSAWGNEAHLINPELADVTFSRPFFHSLDCTYLAIFAMGVVTATITHPLDVLTKFAELFWNG